MKRFKPALLWMLAVPFFLACEGEPGPPGPQGNPGIVTVGLMYEVEFDLNSGNNWSQVYTFPPGDEILWEDVVLVYLLNGEVDGKDLWRLMPVSFFSDAGTLNLNYDFTVDDVNIFAEASFPLDPNLDHFDNEIARIVVVPAAESPNFRKMPIDYSNFEEVKAAFNLKEPKKLSK
ncbi:MAG TPA: hypothetical protein VD908_02300 [Cytophagales bacterium]|nr:hypothetical protein [Cytophagales bacterium]